MFSPRRDDVLLRNGGRAGTLAPGTARAGRRRKTCAYLPVGECCAILSVLRLRCFFCRRARGMAAPGGG